MELSNLTGIFEGKAMGVHRQESPFGEVGIKDEVQRAKSLAGTGEHIFGASVKGLDSSILDGKKLKFFDKGGKVNMKADEYFPKLGGQGFNVDTYFPAGKKKKKMNIDNYFPTGKTKTFKVDTYMPKLSAKKLPMNVFGLERNARKHSLFKPEKVARRRSKQQIGLTMYGDIDNDKLANILDCSPFDPNKQGFMTKMGNYVQGKGFVEGPSETQQIFTTTADVEPTYLPVEDVTTGPNILQRVGTGVGNLWEASGAPEALQRAKEQREWEESIRREAQAKGLEYAKQLKVEDIYKQYSPQRATREAVQKYAPRKSALQDRRPVSQVSRGFQTISSGMQAGLGPLQTEGDKISSLIGMRSSLGRQAAYSLVQPITDESASYKIAMSLGLDPEKYPSYTPPQQLPQPQQQPQYQQPQYQRAPPQQRQDSEVWSPYSKKRVTYIRGPYNKRTY